MRRLISHNPSLTGIVVSVLVGVLVVALFLLTTDSHDYSWGVRQANAICHSHNGVSRITDAENATVLTYICRDGIAGTVDY